MLLGFQVDKLWLSSTSATRLSSSCL